MARPIWTGSITFGLVSVPVRLEMAVHEKSISFHMMSSDGACRLRRKLFCPETGKEFDFNQTARGIEIAKGEYVLLDESEIKRLKPERGRTIEIIQFVKEEELDPIYFDRVYYVVPDEGSAKPYRLLFDAMHKSRKLALAQFVMRERQYLCVIRPLTEGLALHTMHYADEVQRPEDAMPGTLEKIKSGSRELEIAEQLIQSMSSRLDLSKYHDEYRERLQELIDRRKHGKTVEVSDVKDDNPPPRTVNLIDALRRSLKSASPAGNGRTSRGNGHPPARRRIARQPRRTHTRK